MFRLLFVGATAFVLGCGTPDAGSEVALPTFEVRDSAGIEIVESGDSLWRVWHLFDAEGGHRAGSTRSP